MTAALPEAQAAASMPAPVLDLQELLSCRGVAEFLNLSPKTVRAALYCAELPGVLAQGRWYIRREAAVVWAGERLAARGGRAEWRGRPRRVRAPGERSQ